MWCFTFGMLSADWGKATNEGIYLMGIICGGTSTFFTWLTLVKWNE